MTQQIMASLSIIKHIWNYKNKPSRSSSGAIKDSELEMNNDIIRRGENYFDDK